MTGTPSFRRAVFVLLALVTLLATAGCVNLPANTNVNVVGNPAKGGTGADVRIWPQAPRRADKPEQIVEGFIQTAASDPSNLPIAQDYLAGGAQSSWNPNRVAVFGDLSSPSLSPDQNEPGHIKVQITGTMIAKVSDTGAYQQVLDPIKDFNYVFSLTLDPAKGYRIDRLPSDFGILLPQEAFRANYAAYYLYYVNQSGPTPSMIPVPDYRRSQAGDAVIAQSLATALFSGAPNALNGIADLAAPNASLASGGSVTISPDNVASVPIKAPSNCTTAGRSACGLLADELLATFSSLASVNKVDLVDPHGNPLASSLSLDMLESRYNIAVNAAKSTSFYYLDAKNQVNRYESVTGGTNSTNVDQVGPDNRKYSQVAVGFAKPQTTYAAVVDDKGSKLYVGTPGSSKDSEPVYTAATGHGISSLTWDAFGHLWFLDTAGAAVSLYRLDMTAQPKPFLQQVPTAGDGDPVGTIDGIAVAPDGRRIAVSYTDSRTPGSPVTYSVAIGMVTNAQSGLEANLSYGIEQPVVYHWTSVVDVSWHGSQAVAVLGSASSSSPPTISELNSDGSPVINAADLSPVTYTPPTATTGIEWTGSALLATTHSGPANAPVQQIEQYSFATNTWTVDANGFSPTYAN